MMRRALLLPLILVLTAVAFFGGGLPAQANTCNLNALKPSLGTDPTNLYGNFTVSYCGGVEWNVFGWVESYRQGNWQQVQYSREINATRNGNQTVHYLVLGTFQCTPGRVYRTFVMFGDGSWAQYSGGIILC